MKVSASQFSNFTDCRRKWWLSRVAKLPEVAKGYLTFGTVLHACLERWCSGDANGRVPSPAPEALAGQIPGEPVEVFPRGWEIVEEKGVKVSVTPNEAALIRKLVEQAIERGIVVRGDGRVLEREISLPLIEGVELIGFIDCFIPGEPPEIQDHKSFGESSTRFLKQSDPTSPNYLGKDQQLRTYAAAISQLEGWTGPVKVRHNQFPKFADPRGPRTAEAVLEPAVLAEHWAHIQDLARSMILTAGIKEWKDVPGPEDPNTCHKYGGCPFREICGRVVTLDGYRAKVEKQIEALATERPNVKLDPKPKKKSTMSGDVFARAKAKAQPAPAATATAPAPAAPQAATPTSINGGVPPPAQPVAAVENPPPWANPTCTSCKGTGFNSKGRPCPICDAFAKKLNKPTSGKFNVSGSLEEGFAATARPEFQAELGGLAWSSKGGTVEASAPVPAPATMTAPGPQGGTVSSVAVVMPVAAPVVAQAPDTAAVMAGTLATPAEIEPLPVEEKAGKGRPKLGITILVGCVQLKGPSRPTVLAQALLEQVGAELAKDMGASSYWELDTWKRRDRIRQRAGVIAEALGKTVLLVPGVRDPDVDSLVSALVMHADTVIEGVR